jgi:hypothetical protein
LKAQGFPWALVKFRKTLIIQVYSFNAELLTMPTLIRPFFAVLLLLAGPANLGAAEATLGSGQEPAPAVQPSPLTGLWSLSLGGDFASLGDQDLKSFYPAGSIGAPASHLTPGFFLLGRKHVSDSFYAVGGLSSLSKGYTVDRSGGQDLYQWDTVFISTGGGWMLSRALNFGLFAQAEAGWLVMTDGSFESTGSSATKGAFEGSAIATQFSAGGLWFLMPSVAIDLSGGYRFARLPLRFSTSAGAVNPGFAPEPFADFSGYYGRIGIDFFWGLRNPWGPSEAPPPPSGGPPGSE